MYESKKKSYSVIAVIYWIIHWFGLFIEGILYKNNVPFFSIIYDILFISGILIVTFKDKSVKNLGFTKEKLKVNLPISIGLILIIFIISVFISSSPLIKLLKLAGYYLFYISVIEEIIYRGFIQNYLFGLKIKRSLIFIIGALMFSLSHLPFQMFIHDNVTISYVFSALPQLVGTFLIHLILCFITAKRKDITIPIALHFALDYIQTVLDIS